jgi:hypothetical protein
VNGDTATGWLPAGSGYEVALSSGRIVARNAQGARLKSMPPVLKDDPAVAGLRQLRDWLARHEAQVRADVERWMVHSLPVTARLLATVWADDAWRAELRDLIVTPYGQDGPDLDRAGFLRDVDPARGIGVVDLDGESAWLSAERFTIPHPVLLADLDELREFAVELNMGSSQLFRDVHDKPADAAGQAAAIARYEGAHYAQQRLLTSRAIALGYLVRAGTVRCRIREDGHTIDATVWAGESYPGEPAWTGALQFADAQGRAMPTVDVPRIAWSEGVRLAAALHAGRTVTEEGS